MAKRYVLTSEIARVKAKHPPFELLLPELPGNADAGEPSYPKKTIKVPAMQTLPDDVVLYSNTQPVRAARLLLGDDYQHYLAAGGTAQILFGLIQEHAQADLGESGASDDS